MQDFIARILVVDDQPASLGLLIAYLQNWQIDLVVVRDGADALRIATEGRPDLILLDALLPKLDGFTVCSRLKADARTASIPVVFLSAAIEIEHKLRAFATGGADYITKPFAEQEVLARVFLQLGDRGRLKTLSDQTLDESLGGLEPACVQRRDRRIYSQAVAILTRQLNDPPNAVDLARRVGTNQQRLTRVFREQVGMSAYEYLQQLRLERGRSLLHDTDLQVQLIADQIGYRNAGDFTRAFRRRFGVAPREYRRGRILAESAA